MGALQAQSKILVPVNGTEVSRRAVESQGQTALGSPRSMSSAEFNVQNVVAPGAALPPTAMKKRS
jgi:hypothetical protein